MWMKSPYKKRFPEGEVGMIKLFWGTLTVFIGLLSLAAPTVSAVESSCLERCVVEHPQYGFPQCRELGGFLQGDTCFEVYNDCLQSCQMTSAPSRFIPPPTQTANQWRQRSICEDNVYNFPYEIASGDVKIDFRWSGQCECYNGQFFVAECGHESVTCDEVCSGTASF